MAKRRAKKKASFDLRPTKKASGIIKVLGSCNDCDAQWSGGATSMQAVRHFNDTGHHIRVEQHIWWERKSPDV